MLVALNWLKGIMGSNISAQVTSTNVDDVRIILIHTWEVINYLDKTTRQFGRDKVSNTNRWGRMSWSNTERKMVMWSRQETYISISPSSSYTVKLNTQGVKKRNIYHNLFPKKNYSQLYDEIWGCLTSPWFFLAHLIKILWRDIYAYIHSCCFFSIWCKPNNRFCVLCCRKCKNVYYHSPTQFS